MVRIKGPKELDLKIGSPGPKVSVCVYSVCVCICAAVVAALRTVRPAHELNSVLPLDPPQPPLVLLDVAGGSL